MEETVLPTR